MGAEGSELLSRRCTLTVADLLSISLICSCPAQVLSSLLDLQLLADLSANPFTLLVQKLLYTRVRKV